MRIQKVKRKPAYPVQGVYHVFIRDQSELPLSFYFTKNYKVPIHQMEESDIACAMKLLNKGPGFNHKPIQMYIEALNIQQQFLSNCNSTKPNAYYNYAGKKHWYYSKPKIITPKVNLCEKIAKFLFPEYLFTKMYTRASTKKELAQRFNSLLEVFQK